MATDALLNVVTNEELVIEIELHKDRLDERKQKFVESVCEYFYANKTITESQRKHLEVYLKEVKGDLYE